MAEKGKNSDLLSLLLHLIQNYDRISLEATVTNPQDRSSQRVKLEVEGFLEKGSVTPQSLEFLKACLVAKVNLAVSSLSGSANRKLVQALISLLPGDEQILAIQNADEPSLVGKGLTTLRANLSPGQGKHIITRHYLLTLVPKMHPQRLLLDRVQGSEALPLLKLLFAMDGVMFSIVADSPEEALSNLERMLLLSESGLNISMIRRILSSSLDLIIQLQESQGGSTRIVNLTEVCEAEDYTIVLRDIFLHRELEEKRDEPLCLLRPTGIRPKFADRLEMLGISLPSDIFISRHEKKGAAP